MPDVLFKAGGFALGVYDESNFFIAEVRVAGAGAKDAGQDRLHNMTYHPRLEEACISMVPKIANHREVSTVKQYAEEVRAAGDAVAAQLKALLKGRRIKPSDVQKP